MNTALSTKAILTMEAPPLDLACMCGKRHIQAIQETGIRDSERRGILERSAYVLGWMMLHDVWMCRACWQGDARYLDLEEGVRYLDWKHKRDDAVNAWRRRK